MRKKNLGTKIMTFLIAVMIGVTCVAVASKNTNAKNSVDTEWSYVLSVDSTSQTFLDYRMKEDTSKIYFNWGSVISGNLSGIAVEPYGYSTSSGRQPAGDSYGQHKVCVINNTGKYSITNWVHELGYTYATVGMRSVAGSGLAKGVWSPDSIYTYTVIP